MVTIQSVSAIIDQSICDSEATYQAYRDRLKESNPTRDQNSQSHFCVYFLPYNADSKKVFLIHHKKSGLWLSPGGHVDHGETLLQTLNREINEELGVKDFFQESPLPFLLTITPIENTVQPCKLHYDVWFLMRTHGGDFHIDPTEFHDTQWFTIAGAEKIVTDKANQKALKIINDRIIL